MEKNKMEYVIRDREAGNIITSFSTKEEAEAEMLSFEDHDKNDYEIWEVTFSCGCTHRVQANSLSTNPKFPCSGCWQEETQRLQRLQWEREMAMDKS